MDWTELPWMLLHLDQQLDIAVAHLGPAVYLMLFAVVFCEIAFIPLFFLPGDPLLFICGALCATGALKIWIVMPLLFTACVAASLVSYRTGRAVGQKLSRSNYRWLDRTALERTHAFYERHGALTFVLSPFIAVVRTFAPFVGGIARMNFGKFVIAVISGAALWTIALVPGGYLFGSIPLIHDHLSAIVLLGIGAGVGALLVGSTTRFLRSRLRRR
jgi:membrane-associated protein